MRISDTMVIMLAFLLAGCTTTPVSEQAETEAGFPVALTAVPDDGDDAGPEVEPIVHAAVGATVVVSSSRREFPGEGPASALVDGNLRTRWSSEYAEPQQVDLMLPSPLNPGVLQLHWEAASAQAYTVSITEDGAVWRQALSFETEDPGPRVDEHVLDDYTDVIGVRIDLLRRVNPEWGFSLYQVALWPKEQVK